MKAEPDIRPRPWHGGVNPEKYAGHEPSCTLQIKSVEGIIGQ